MFLSRLIKRVYKYLSRLYWQFIYIKIAKHIIKKATPKIADLSRSQRKIIRKYYKKNGYKNIYTGYHRILTSINKQFSEKYIPEGIFNTDILPKLNNWDHIKSWGDKSIFNRLFHDIRFPETIIYNINGVFYDDTYKKINKENAMMILEDLDDFVIKPSLETGSGKGVMYYKEPIDVAKVFDIYKENFIVQKKIIQHEFYNVFNNSSINSLKIMSLYWEDKVHILSSVIRVGPAGSFTDNVGTGKGYMINVNHNGFLHGNKFNFYGNVMGKSKLNSDYYNNVIPGYFEAIDLITKTHIQMPYFKLISWDISIDINCRPIIIEYNLKSPDAKMHQIYNGPLFGDLTDEILQFVATN